MLPCASSVQYFPNVYAFLLSNQIISRSGILALFKDGLHRQNCESSSPQVPGFTISVSITTIIMFITTVTVLLSLCLSNTGAAFPSGTFCACCFRRPQFYDRNRNYLFRSNNQFPIIQSKQCKFGILERERMYYVMLNISLSTLDCHYHRNICIQCMQF